MDKLMHELMRFFLSVFKITLYLFFLRMPGLEDPLEALKNIREKTSELRESLSNNWLGWSFNMLFFTLAGGLQDLIQYALMFVTVIVVVGITISYVKPLLLKAVTSHFRMLQDTR